MVFGDTCEEDEDFGKSAPFNFTFIMKKLFLFVLLLLCRISTFALENNYTITIEGAEPSGKKYYFAIDKPKDFDSSKIQYALWKMLKDKGYSLTDSVSADIIIQVHYISVANDRENREYVPYAVEEVNLGKTKVQMPVMSSRSTGHYTVNTVCMDIKAFPKKYDENTIPFWHIFTQRENHDVEVGDIAFIDYCWFSDGCHNMSYNSKKDIKFSKAKIEGKKATPEQLAKLENTLKVFSSMSEAELYNSQITKK